MRLTSVIGLAAVIGMGFFAGGCAKKITKVSVMPQTKVEMPPPVKPPATAERDSFATMEADSILKATLKTIYFDFDKANLTSDAISDLENIGPFLRSCTQVSILIEGNCDERGSAEYNVGLGQRRAQAVKDWLVTYGIPDNRIEVTSYGKERPAFPNCQEELCHAKNRRDEFKVLSGSSSAAPQARR